MSDQKSRALLDAMKRDHRELSEMVHRLDLALGQAMAANWPQTSTDEVMSSLEELERCLTEHFAREEEGGILEEAVATAPRLGRDAEDLLNEHGKLLAEVTALTRLGRENSHVLTASWPPFAERLSAVLKELLAHERHENAMLQQAFHVAGDV
jgi:hypothetical protein